MLVFCIERSYWWSLYLRILRKGQQQKTIYLLVFFLWLVKSVNNRLVDHLEMSLFSDFQCGLWFIKEKQNYYSFG